MVAVSTVDPSLPPTLALSLFIVTVGASVSIVRSTLLASYGLPAKSVKTPPAMVTPPVPSKSSVGVKTTVYEEPLPETVERVPLLGVNTVLSKIFSGPDVVLLLVLA